MLKSSSGNNKSLSEKNFFRLLDSFAFVSSLVAVVPSCSDSSELSSLRVTFWAASIRSLTPSCSVAFCIRLSWSSPNSISYLSLLISALLINCLKGVTIQCMDSEKTAKTAQKLNDRQIVYSALMEHGPAGMTKKKAAELSGYNPKSVYRVEKAISKYSLKHPKRLKKASKVVDAFLSGKAVGDSDLPSPAVIRATAEMVYDRVEPVIKTEPLSDSLSFCQLHIDKIEINLNPEAQLDSQPIININADSERLS